MRKARLQPSAQHQAIKAVVFNHARPDLRESVLKLGAHGILVSDGLAVHAVPGLVVNSVDATGAGDCCAGALLARLADGDDFSTALHFANAAAALTTTGFGAVAPLPNRATVSAYLKNTLPSE